MFQIDDLMIKVVPTESAKEDSDCWVLTFCECTVINPTCKCTCTKCTSVTNAQSACCGDKLTGKKDSAESRIGDLAELRAELDRQLGESATSSSR